MCTENCRACAAARDVRASWRACDGRLSPRLGDTARDCSASLAPQRREAAVAVCPHVAVSVRRSRSCTGVRPPRAPTRAARRFRSCRSGARRLSRFAARARRSALATSRRAAQPTFRRAARASSRRVAQGHCSARAASDQGRAPGRSRARRCRAAPAGPARCRDRQRWLVHQCRPSYRYTSTRELSRCVTLRVSLHHSTDVTARIPRSRRRFHADHLAPFQWRATLTAAALAGQLELDYEHGEVGGL